MGLRALLKQVWTIARHSIMQAIRMRIVIVLVAFLLVLVPALPFLLKSDNTHAGQLRIVMTYSIYLISFLLSILTLFLSAITLNAEIKNQYIFLLDPKPVPRGVVLVGKWAGVMLIDLALLTTMLGVSYGLVRYLGRQAPGEPDAAYELVKAQVLTARRIVRPPLPDLSAWVEQEIKLLKEKNLMPANKTERWVRERLFERMSKSAWRISPGERIEWVVSGVPKFEGWLVLRFRHYGDSGPHDHELPGEFVINEKGQPSSRISQPFRVSTPHSFAVPASVVRPDGTVTIAYMNQDMDGGVAALFPFEDGIQVLYPAASLAENFARAGLVMLLKLAFIAIVGIFASTFLSFPVAALFSIVVFAIGHMSNFILTDLLYDLYIFGSSAVPPGTPLNPLDNAIRNVLAAFFSIFPDFSRYDVVSILSDGQLINLRLVFWCFVWLPLVRGGALALAGWYIFRRRELAALTATT